MPYLIDTNALIRLVVRADLEHAIIRVALNRLQQQGEMRYYTPQNAVEFWSVCTRPATARGGYGMSLKQANHNARLFERILTLLPDSPAVHGEWRRLVVAQGVSGVQVHDARLVAFMQVYNVTHILTLNTKDFTRYPGIIAVHPAHVT